MGGSRFSMRALLALAIVVLLACAETASASASQPFRTGFLDNVFSGPDAATAFERAANAGATIERLPLFWSAVATRPADPTDPDDPAYDWSAFDRAVDAAVAAEQAPIANIVGWPSWAAASGVTYPTTYPDPVQMADFAYAAARRYDGIARPRITYWEIFGEPNLGLFIEPQFVNGQPESAIWYRDVLDR